MVYEKKNRPLVFSGSRKIPTLGSTVQWETRQAWFPTGTVGPRVDSIYNDGFYLSYMGTYNELLYYTLETSLSWTYVSVFTYYVIVLDRILKSVECVLILIHKCIVWQN